MELEDKIILLAEGAKYDVSCSSSGVSRRNTPGRLGSTHKAGICHSWSEDGRCITLLKILLSNNCSYDCRYCQIRRSNDLPRASLSVKELVDLTMNFYRRNYIEGLFLSSAVLGTPEKTMEMMLQAVRSLRRDCGFNGYIHLKGIPGASPKTIREAGFYADRMSINIELPTENSLKRLAPQKNRKAILAPMAFLDDQDTEFRQTKGRTAPRRRFLPAGQTTQMIIGATPETDNHIIHLMEGLYRRFHLKRVYYSAYVPVNRDRLLPAAGSPPLLREHRLYQADWLLRFYRYRADEILDDASPFLDVELDPKAAWAVRHPAFFPLEINRASYEEILRIPGIGLTSALRIIKARRHSSLEFSHLKAMGVVLKRARHFILCRGRSLDNIEVGGPGLREKLLPMPPGGPVQLELFP